MKRNRLEHAASDLSQTLGQLVRRVRAAAATHELSLTERAVLAHLERDGPSTTASLARAEGVKPQSMSTIVAALEERQLVERAPHPTDGRQLNVNLTSQGAAVRKSMREAKQSWLAQAMARLGEPDLATLLEAAKIMERLAHDD